jgi:hypothetical protein
VGKSEPLTVTVKNECHVIDLEYVCGHIVIRQNNRIGRNAFRCLGCSACPSERRVTSRFLTLARTASAPVRQT